jgi:NAD(P)-dependent dehydrogenase (short-subunit alcohol dehydrogenase family)
VGPILRGALAWPTGDEDRPYLRSVLEWRATDELLTFVNSAEAQSLACTGPLTSDHLIHTKPWPLFVENPSWSDEEALGRQLKEGIDAYRRDYEAYVQAHGASSGSVPPGRDLQADRSPAVASRNRPDDRGIDPSPRVVLMPGAGVFCWGRTKRDACITADITERTLATKIKAQAIGTYESLPPADLYAMEYRTLQLDKLRASTPGSLEGQIVVVSGGAGAIGAAVGEVCARAGAHIVLADLDESRLARVVERIREGHGAGSALGVTMDVTDEASVRAGFEETVCAYGGVDVVVPNAGVAHVAAIEELDVSDFRRVMDVNAVGYLLFMQEGIKILKKQGLGGHIIVNASKNVFGPGKDFGAYSASKAAGHQLGKIAAIELAPFGIRVNMINADAIFGDEDTPSGLWAEVGPKRAKSRNLDPKDIPDYYRNRNLLKARIHGYHVGNAVVFFAGNSTPTTGATLPIDGGVIEAFPR